MLQEERHKTILETLKKSDFVKASEMVKQFQVSADTIRRDLEQLEKRGLLKRVHGGAVLESTSNNTQAFPYREIKHKENKSELAALICQYVTEGQVIALNAGTTNVEVAGKLADSFERLTVITNGLRIVEKLIGKSGFNVILPGGMLDHEEFSLYGRKCEEGIANYNIDIALISINAISLDKGFTDFRMNETGVIQAMMKHTRRTFVVADSSKFNVVSYINVCSLSEVDAIVTDSNVSQETIQTYKKKNIKILSPRE